MNEERWSELHRIYSTAYAAEFERLELEAGIRQASYYDFCQFQAGATPRVEEYAYAAVKARCSDSEWAEFRSGMRVGSNAQAVRRVNRGGVNRDAVRSRAHARHLTEERRLRRDGPVEVVVALGAVWVKGYRNSSLVALSGEQMFNLDHVASAGREAVQRLGRDHLSDRGLRFRPSFRTRDDDAERALIRVLVEALNGLNPPSPDGLSADV